MLSHSVKFANFCYFFCSAKKNSRQSGEDLGKFFDLRTLAANVMVRVHMISSTPMQLSCLLKNIFFDCHTKFIILDEVAKCRTKKALKNKNRVTPKVLRKIRIFRIPNKNLKDSFEFFLFPLN